MSFWTLARLKVINIVVVIFFLFSSHSTAAAQPNQRAPTGYSTAAASEGRKK